MVDKKCPYYGTKLFSLISSNGFSQLISESTHIQTSSSFCIDLIFPDQPNLSVNLGVHSSLHQNCHHEIVYSTFNLTIYSPPPPTTTISKITMGL